MMGKDSVLSCRNLTFSYGKKKILKNINLEFYPGEVIGLIGCNGAGKSTLLACLCGLLHARSDRLKVNELDILKSGRKDIAKNISFVPQEHEDMFPFSVLDVVAMGRTAFLSSFGAPGEEDLQMAQDVLAELQIAELSQRIYTSLSGGEKQLVLLARALVQTRKIIFLDEPTNHLDYKNRYHMLAQLKKLTREHGSCIIACLHDPNHALLFTDRVILLDAGAIISQGRTSKILTCETVSRLYGIATRQDRFSGLHSIQPAFVYPSFAGRVLLLVGNSGEGKTTLLKKMVKENDKVKFGGIICPGKFKNGRRYSSFINCLQTGVSTLFAKRETPCGNSPFVFNEKGQQLADNSLKADRHRKTDCVVVDEIGPLELKGRGHSPLLAPLLSLENPKHIWAVRPQIVNEVCRRWMLVNPVIVKVSQPDVERRINRFLHGREQRNA